jgi:D-serine deaminase-like pyridoxal phosphate-dependent protein
MTTLAEEVVRTFGSPSLMIDLDRVDRNIARLQAACEAAGLANRPHIKTHKSPDLARRQREAGARGLTCQTLGEAEVMAQAGLTDILISYNLLGADKLGRLTGLLRRTALTVSADHPAVVAGLAEAAQAAGRVLDVVVECDTGRGRAGVAAPGEAVALARRIADAPSLRFAGVLLYPPEDGTAATQAFLDAAQEGLRGEGLVAGIVSTGGTPNLRHLGEVRGATEHRSGTSIFNDRMMVACGAATLDDCALEVVTTVVSRATPTRGVLDAGSKTLTADPGGGLDGYGLIREYPQARIHKLAEEHGFLDLSGVAAGPEVGTVVRVVPNHVCVVVNMADRLVATRGGRIVGEIPVAARGRR